MTSAVRALEKRITTLRAELARLESAQAVIAEFNGTAAGAKRRALDRTAAALAGEPPRRRGRPRAPAPPGGAGEDEAGLMAGLAPWARGAATVRQQKRAVLAVVDALTTAGEPALPDRVHAIMRAMGYPGLKAVPRAIGWKSARLEPGGAVRLTRAGRARLEAARPEDPPPGEDPPTPSPE